MTIKGSRQFLKRCYQEVRNVGRFAHLADKALQLGLGNQNTQGHIKQAVGATQMFLQQYPQHRLTIQKSDPTQPFPLYKHNSMCADWRSFFQNQTGSYGPKAEFDWDTLRRYLTGKYGGTRKGGGGGDNEFEIVLRLIAEWKL